jgi:hypothetical protein
VDNIVRLSTAVSLDPAAPSTGASAASTVAPVPSAAAPVPSTAASLGAIAPGHTRTRWWVEILTIAWLGWMYDAITNLAPLRLHTALAHAQGILDLERTLHIDSELTLDRWLAGHHTLGLAVSYYYDNAHFVVTLGLLGWLWLRRVDLYRPLRNSLVLVNALAFVVFWRYPVAPPRMLDGFTDVVSSTHAIGSYHTGALASHANELAAMPSLHIAWAVWCTLAIWRMSARRWARALAIAYPCATALAVVATGNHFVLDILGGLAAIAASVLLVALAERRRSQSRGISRGRDRPLFGNSENGA